MPAVDQLKLPALTPDIQTTSRARDQSLPSHFRSPGLLAGPLSAVGPEALSAGASRFPEISIGALISEKDVSTVPLLDQESKNMQPRNPGFEKLAGTAANSTSCFSPPARAVETVQMQSLLPPTEKILSILDYHEQFVSFWGGCLWHGPTLRRQIREACEQTGKIDVSTVDWKWTALIFSILASGLIGSPEGVSLGWGFSIEEKVRLSRLWGSATVTCLNLGDYTSQYHLYSIQAIMNIHGFEHLVGSSNQWASLRAVAMVIAKGLNLHRIGPHPDDSKIAFLDEEQKEAFIEREIGRRVWYASVTQEWLCSSSTTFPGYNIQRKHFTTSKPCGWDEETVMPLEEGTPCFAAVMNYFFDYAYLVLQFGDAMIDAEDLDDQSRYNLVLKWDGDLRTSYAKNIPKFLSHRTPLQPHWPRWVPWARRLHEASCSHKIIMIHQSYLNKAFKDVRFMYSRWACVTAAKHVLSLYPKREPDEPQFWVEQAFSITAGICLIMDLFQRTDFNAETQDYLALVKRAVTYLASFPTSSVANHGVRVLSSLLQEYTKKVDAARGGHGIAQTRPSTQASAGTVPQSPKGYDSSAVAEASVMPPTLPMNPEVPLPSEAAFNFDIDMMQFEDLLDILPTEVGIDTSAFYDGMLSASNGPYNGW
ncbi:transcription elongation factor spt5 [Curvularia kusanoi]|uniref:Transcription elongation factor spt5 n=1 Tax=Curvularia kusanoi TaxID=90978 RepID=A0A9P4WA77_CURKU|nr:transcription elongation factor spt5 [Curvularia kusanoi]